MAEAPAPVTGAPALPDGIVAVVKRDCPTCVLVAPVLGELERSGVALTVYTQDDPDFPAEVGTRRDDRSLEVSYLHGIETVPTLLRVQDGRETDRREGWSRPQWEAFTGVEGIGADLPEHRPGCGSLSVDPNLVDELRVRFEGGGRRSFVDGPFTEAKELVAGFWLWQVRDMDEAREWARRCPATGPDGTGEIEIRPVFEAADFGEAFTPELRAQEERIRAEAAKRQ